MKSWRRDSASRDSALKHLVSWFPRQRQSTSRCTWRVWRAWPVRPRWPPRSWLSLERSRPAIWPGKLGLPRLAKIRGPISIWNSPGCSREVEGAYPPSLGFSRQAIQRICVGQGKKSGRTRLLAPRLGGDDGFGHLFHRLALLAALTAEREVRLFFAESGLTLQDTFGAFDHLSGFQFFRELRAFLFEAGHFDFGADQKANRRDEANFGFAVSVRFAVLQIDDPDRTAAA